MSGYRTSPTNRRTKAAMERIRAHLYDIVRANQPVTVRQVFYQAVSRGVVPKTEAESVEVDAIPPDTLRELVRSLIEQHVDEDALAVVRVAEESERRVLMGMAGGQR